MTNVFDGLNSDDLHESIAAGMKDSAVVPPGMEIKQASAEMRLSAYAPAFDNLRKMVSDLVVNTKEEQIIANEIIGKAKKLVKDLEDTKAGIYDELYPKAHRELMKKVSKIAKDYTEMIKKDVIKVAEKKFLDYDLRLRREAAEKEAAFLAQLQKTRKEVEALNLFVPEELEVKPEGMKAVEKVENITASDSAASYVVNRQAFEVVDFSKIPDEYKILNETAIRKVMNMKKDRPEIPGIKWTVERSLATRQE